MKVFRLLVFVGLIVCLLVVPSEAFVLKVYGNANGDDTIDMRDVTYLKLVLFGKKKSTQFADANFDGKIHVTDIVQVKLIILDKEAKITVQDSAGRNVTIEKPISKIVVLNSDAAEAVKILGAGSKIAGIVDTVQKNTFYFPEISKKTVVGTWKEVDWEKIVELHPNLVIAYTKYGANVDIAEEKLSPFNITVVGLNLYDPRSIREEIATLGYILDKELKAYEYIDWWNKWEDEIEKLVSNKPKPKVFVTSTSAIGKTSEIPTYGSGSTIDEIIKITSGENIAEELGTKYPKVDAEWVITKDPDVIIIKKSYKHYFDSEEEAKNYIDQVLEGKGWDNVSAVKNGRVYIVPWSAVYGSEQPFAIALFAKIEHPEIEIDPIAIYKEFLEKFMGIEMPTDKVFVYPSL